MPVSRYRAFDSVTVEDAERHIQYTVGSRHLSTRVLGVPTDTIAERLIACDSVQQIAADYDLDPMQVMDAIRWELHPRRTRVRMVEKALQRKPIE
jgi:uncharacterized protein (DUF433 family)